MPISEVGTWHRNWEKAQYWVWYGQGWGSNLQAPSRVLLAPSLPISVTPEIDSVHTSLLRDKMATSITGWRTWTALEAALCGERVAITPAFLCESDYLPQCPHKSEQWLGRCSHTFPLPRLAFSVATELFSPPPHHPPPCSCCFGERFHFGGGVSTRSSVASTGMCVFVLCSNLIIHSYKELGCETLIENFGAYLL